MEPATRPTAAQVVLVGMMGSGKTAVGAALADRLGAEHVELDERLEIRSGLSIAEYFDCHGEPAFRALEADLLAECLDTGTGVVSTGGGVVESEANRRRLVAAPATVVWLRARPETLGHRVGAGEGRPLLDGAVEERLAALDAQRAALYAEVADLVVDVDDLEVDQAAARIVALLGAGGPDEGAGR